MKKTFFLAVLMYSFLAIPQSVTIKGNVWLGPSPVGGSSTGQYLDNDQGIRITTDQGVNITI